MTGLGLGVTVAATLEHRPASSSCCGARLEGLGGDDMPRWSCRECGRECARVLGDPVTIRAVSGG